MRETSLTIGARLIGCLCTVGAMMISSQIAVDLMHYTDTSRANTTKWSFESIEFWSVHHSHPFINKDSHLLAVGAYVLFYAVCSGMLVYATYVNRRLLTLPWLFAEGACVLCEASSLFSYFMREKADATRWNVAGVIFCLVLAIAMWCVVYEAQLQWKQLPRERASPRASPCPPPYTERSLEQPHGTHTPGRSRPKMTVV